MFVFVLRILEQANLLNGKYLGIDASGMEANAAMKSIVRRDTGETYQEMLERLAEESGIRTPTRAELIAFDCKRQGKTTANKDWQSSTDETEATYHWDPDNKQKQGSLDNHDMSGWHTYGVIVEKDHIIFTLDGKEWGCIKHPNVTDKHARQRHRHGRGRRDRRGFR